MSEDTLTGTDETFESVALGTDGLVLVDFWAAWCGPCRQLDPILDELARAYRGRMTVVKVDTEANPQVTARYGVTAIPTLVFLRNGEIQKTLHGTRPKRAFVETIDTLLT